MIVIRYSSSGVREQVIMENESYESPHLPGFVVPLAELLAAAEREAEADT
jgi:hypothetical protein